MRAGRDARIPFPILSHCYRECCIIETAPDAPRPQTNQPRLLAIVAGFAAIYIIWGSTYLAIRVAVQTMPPMLLAGSRFILAGLILWSVLTALGRFRATPRQWKDNFFIGAFMLLGGNGLVVWAEQTIPSGIATLIISLNSAIVVAAEWILVTKCWKRWFGKTSGTAPSSPGINESTARPTPLTVTGLLLGLAGLAILVWPSLGVEGAGGLEPLRVLALIAACVSWTIGSLANRALDEPADPFSGAAMQMLGGGVWLAGVGFVLGEAQQWSWSRISWESWLAWGYLVVAGSLIAFTTFIWLMKHCSPTTVSTYAYVNPIVAVFLGWFLLDELIDLRVLMGAAVIVVAVAVITISKQRQAKAATADG